MPKHQPGPGAENEPGRADRGLATGPYKLPYSSAAPRVAASPSSSWRLPFQVRSPNRPPQSQTNSGTASPRMPRFSRTAEARPLVPAARRYPAGSLCSYLQGQHAFLATGFADSATPSPAPTELEPLSSQASVGTLDGRRVLVLRPSGTSRGRFYQYTEGVLVEL